MCVHGKESSMDADSVVKMMGGVVALGLDTLVMATSLGALQVTGKYRIAALFASAEALMPLVGVVTGREVGRWVGHWAALVGGALLVAVAAWLMFFEQAEEDDGQLARGLTGWALVLTALSISVDEFAAGFSIGLAGVPLGSTLVLVALQAFVFTILGLTWGARFGRVLGEWAERLAGAILGLMGAWIAVEALAQPIG
jgi:putative Mn2+ efflux pump MntP